MAELHVTMTARPLNEWSEPQLKRVWRLASGAVQSIGSGGQIPAGTERSTLLASLEMQAAALGGELVRRSAI
jgi:hypothetical protein